MQRNIIALKYATYAVEKRKPKTNQALIRAIDL